MTLGPVRVMGAGVVIMPHVKEVKFMLTINCMCVCFFNFHIHAYMHILVTYNIYVIM